MQIDVYLYEDFRILLSDLFKSKQAEVQNYSQRQLARDAGVKNPGLFNDVIKGRRTLSEDAQKKFAKVLGLNSREYEYFQLLVEFGQTKNKVKKDEAYKKILFRRSRSQFARVNPDLVKYYQDYRYPLVRTSIEASKFRGDYGDLSRFIRPTIPVLELKKIVRELCEWGLVKQNSTGRYDLTDKFVEPPPTFNAQVRQLNRVWLEQSVDALLNIPPEQRHISTMLLSVSQETSDKIKSKMEEVRKEIIDLVDQDANPDRVVQMSLVYFQRGGREIE